MTYVINDNTGGMRSEILFDKLSPDARIHLLKKLNVKECERLCRTCGYFDVFKSKKYDAMWRILIIEYYKYKPIEGDYIYSRYKNRFQKLYNLVDKNSFGNNSLTGKKEKFQIRDFFTQNRGGYNYGNDRFIIRGYARDGVTTITQGVSMKIFDVVQEIVNVDANLDDGGEY